MPTEAKGNAGRRSGANIAPLTPAGVPFEGGEQLAVLMRAAINKVCDRLQLNAYAAMTLSATVATIWAIGAIDDR